MCKKFKCPFVSWQKWLKHETFFYRKPSWIKFQSREGFVLGIATWAADCRPLKTLAFDQKELHVSTVFTSPTIVIVVRESWLSCRAFWGGQSSLVRQEKISRLDCCLELFCFFFSPVQKLCIAALHWLIVNGRPNCFENSVGVCPMISKHCNRYNRLCNHCKGYVRECVRSVAAFRHEIRPHRTV